MKLKKIGDWGCTKTGMKYIKKRDGVRFTGKCSAAEKKRKRGRKATRKTTRTRKRR